MCVGYSLLEFLIMEALWKPGKWVSPYADENDLASYPFHWDYVLHLQDAPVTTKYVALEFAEAGKVGV